jgi:hypothetical protein
MLLSVVESVHAAPFTHGELAHSSTSRSQLPLRSADAELSDTVHSVLNSEIWVYAQRPLAKPAVHAHEKLFI